MLQSMRDLQHDSESQIVLQLQEDMGLMLKEGLAECSRSLKAASLVMTEAAHYRTVAHCSTRSALGGQPLNS